MTVTKPARIETIGLHEIREGQPIAIGNLNELSAINQQTTLAFANAGHPNRIMMAIQRGRFASGDGVPGLSGVYQTIGEGQIRVWGEGARYRVHIFGALVDVRGTIGGTALPVASILAGPASTWVSGTEAAITGASISSGFATVLIEAQYRNAAYNLFYICVEEVELLVGELPTPAAPTEAAPYFPLHDAPFTADEPLDAWLLQTMDNNILNARVERARGMLHCFPTTRPHLLQSCHWRLDGPYTIAVPPYADSVTVVLSVGLAPLFVSADVDIFALTEQERFEDIVNGSRPVTVSAAATVHLRFDGLKVEPGGSGNKTQKVWVAYRSGYGAVGPSADIGAYNASQPWRVYCEDIFSANIPWPTGICGFSGVDTTPSAGKQSFAFSTPTSFYDIAGVLGENAVTPSSDPVRQPIDISPHPRTGFTTEAQFSPILQSGSGSSEYTSQVSVRVIGVLELRGVYIEAAETSEAPRKLAWPTTPPAASLVQVTAGSINSWAVFGPPQVMTRHWGSRNLREEQALPAPAGSLFPEGHYLFMPRGSGGTPASFIIEIPIGADPDKGIGSAPGLRSDFLRAQLILMSATQVTAQINIDNLVTIVLTGGTAVEFRVPIQPLGGMYHAPSPTVADATLASAFGSAEVSNNGNAYENSYNQQYTWPDEGFHTHSPWVLSPVVQVARPLNYPTIATLTVTNGGGVRNDVAIATQTSLVVAGMHVWFSPRVPG